MFYMFVFLWRCATCSAFACSRDETVCLMKFASATERREGRRKREKITRERRKIVRKERTKERKKLTCLHQKHQGERESVRPPFCVCFSFPVFFCFFSSAQPATIERFVLFLALVEKNSTSRFTREEERE